ncbi:MAG: universal stress protein [Streptomycetaceae bacterium]|nr:universal stress protein [Streptomycetaceae bacterium]
MNAPSDAEQGHVVVAVDGSEAADNAVDWAADEAALRGTDLEVLHAWQPRSYEADWYARLLYRKAGDLVATAAERARRRRPEAAVTTTRVDGKPADVVADAAGRAALLVMGSRGLGGFTGMLLGSVSLHVAAERAGRLLVVRPGPVGSAEPPHDEDYFRIDHGSIVVGVADDSCRPAVAEAFAEAARRRARVVAVHAWSFPDRAVLALGPNPGVLGDAVDSRRRRGEEILTRAVGPERDAYPDVPVAEEVVEGRRAQAMLDAAKGATMVVVATHPRRGGRGRHLGPVTHALLEHADAPVLLVPTGARGADA